MNDKILESEAPRNQRPADVTSFFYQGEAYENWKLHNKNKNRFFVLNIDRVLDLLDISHTKMEADFAAACASVSASAWATQYRSEWDCSHTQIYPANRNAAKTFSRAVSVIEALNVTAARTRPDVNVYDFLRIVPAFYFIDGFDEERLAALEAHFSTLTPEQQREGLGSAGATIQTFSEACLLSVSQSSKGRLLKHLATGYCATKFVVEGIRTFVNSDRFPANLHVGPVLRAGEVSPQHGELPPRKAAARDLLVPRRREPARLIAESGYLA